MTRPGTNQAFRSPFMRNPDVWTPNGRMRDAAVQDIARRLQAGERPATIAAVLKISLPVAQRRCRDIAAALKLPTDETRRAAFRHEVAELAAQGMTDVQIAERLGHPYRSVVSARVRAAGTKFSILRLTPDEHARMDAMLREGMSAAEVAEEIGCHKSLVSKRARQIDPEQIRNARPPCACGKPAGHGGRCLVIVAPEKIRERLLAGETCTDIARSVGLGGQYFKARYCQPVIDQLTAEGHRCGCGQPFGHPATCKVIGARQRKAFSDDQLTRARDLVAAGASAATLRSALGITANSAGILLGETRARLASVGVPCPCGQPIDHLWSCPARNPKAKARARFRFSEKAVASTTKPVRQRVSKLARGGWGRRVIVERTGQRSSVVARLVAELGAAGLLPATCAGCDRPFDHHGRCTHTAVAEQTPPADQTRRPLRSKLPPEIVAEIKARLRAGQSGTQIGVALDQSPSTINGIIARLRRDSTYPHKPCACGRPARHPGGCAAKSPKAVGKMERTRIEADVTAGVLPHLIAQRLGLSLHAVLKHSAALRAKLHADGVACACGRILGHPEWCAIKWDALGKPRGGRPLPSAKVKIAKAALLRGDAAAGIAARIGTGINRIWAVRQALTDKERDRRAGAVRARLRLQAKAQGTDLMPLVQAAVSRRVDRAVRDDVVSELHLALLEGRIEPEQLTDAARTFASRAIAQWQKAGGARSLDQPIAGDATRTLVDLLGDDTTTAQIDQLELGARP